MKKLVVFAALFMAAFGAYAQDCEAIMLPFFKGNMEKLNDHRNIAPDKFEWRCTYATAAFIESDTIPTGLAVYNISEVRSLATGETLSENFVVDLNTLSYYAYDFFMFQGRHYSVEERVCFRTPGSAHPYLVLRSTYEMSVIADEVLKKWEK